MGYIVWCEAGSSATYCASMKYGAELHLIKRNAYDYSVEDVVESKHPDFDLLMVHEQKERKEIFASKGKAVIHVRYHGYADINSLIENTEEKINYILE
ncbi:hypothetical protein [Mesobacillus maritimus]|uniref:hypothetical protein n=1 Tax=Mesobacillus maritimus TaxID=1643336 RepID=UPI003851458A